MAGFTLRTTAAGDAVGSLPAAHVCLAGLDPGRVDLRHLPCVTIDPPGARDFDDAVTVIEEGDGLHDALVDVTTGTRLVHVQLSHERRPKVTLGA